MTTTQHERVSGSLFGLAFGDALGKPTEFLDLAAIVARYGPGGPCAPTGNPALVTDDTQMALAVGRAITTADTLSPAALEGLLTHQFVDWLLSPDNNRAPGSTCLRATRKLSDGHHWLDATVGDSKGCGANMRVTPVGLLPQRRADHTTRAAIAQYQAAFTHGHPTALAASDLTARAVTELLDGLTPADLPAALRDYAHSQRHTYHHDWLADLWHRPGIASAEQFIATGWDQCLMALDRLDTAVAIADRHSDPCQATGAGWVAEEALATALLCYLLHPDNPVAALRRAATTSGDSDSIACLTGAFAGATHGITAWPTDWTDRIEHAADLHNLTAALT